MGIAIAGFSTATGGGGSPNTSVAFAGLPGTVGNIQIAFIYNGEGNADVTVTPPANFTLLTSAADAAGPQNKLSIYTARTSLVAAPTFTLTGNFIFASWCVELSGISTTPLDTYTVSAGNPPTTTLVGSNPITPTYSNEMLLAFYGTRPNNTVVTPPNGYTAVAAPITETQNVSFQMTSGLYYLTNPSPSAQQPQLNWSGFITVYADAYVTVASLVPPPLTVFNSDLG